MPQLPQLTLGQLALIAILVCVALATSGAKASRVLCITAALILLALLTCKHP